jgi:hypothetical protein
MIRPAPVPGGVGQHDDGADQGVVALRLEASVANNRAGGVEAEEPATAFRQIVDRQVCEERVTETSVAAGNGVGAKLSTHRRRPSRLARRPSGGLGSSPS